MTIALWSSDAWRQEAVAWLDERLAAGGTRRVGEVTQPHLRPWATVLRAPTTRGVVWLKAAGPETAFEVELYLGLVELLRHRCRTVYCIDASGDAPPFATTLAEAITLAYEELGVRITLRDHGALVPGSADPLAPPEVLERLNARLSRSAVCVADVEYPEAFAVTPLERPSRLGTLVVARPCSPRTCRTSCSPTASPGRGGRPWP